MSFVSLWISILTFNLNNSTFEIFVVKDASLKAEFPDWMSRSWVSDTSLLGQGQATSVAATLNMRAELVRLTAGYKKA